MCGESHPGRTVGKKVFSVGSLSFRRHISDVQMNHTVNVVPFLLLKYTRFQVLIVSPAAGV